MEYNFFIYDVRLLVTSLFLNYSLLEKGRQILMKDNLIDEEKAKKEEAAQESLEQKLQRIGTCFDHVGKSHFKFVIFSNFLDYNMENILTRFSRLMAEYSSFQTKIKQRLSELEKSEQNV